MKTNNKETKRNIAIFVVAVLATVMFFCKYFLSDKFDVGLFVLGLLVFLFLVRDIQFRVVVAALFVNMLFFIFATSIPENFISPAIYIMIAIDSGVILNLGIEALCDVIKGR